MVAGFVYQAGGVQMVRSRAARLTLLLVLSTPVGLARAQVESREGIALQNQILDLRRQLQILQDQGARGGNVSPSRPPIPYVPPVSYTHLTLPTILRV